MTSEHISVIRAESGSIAVGGNLTIGIPPEQLPEIIAAARGDWNSLTEVQRASIHTLEGILGGVTQKAVLAFFRTIDEAGVPLDQLEIRLLEIADRYRKLQEQVSATPGDIQEVACLKGKVFSALDEGDLEQADEWLGELLKLEDALIEERQIQAAQTAAQRGELALTRLRYDEAVEHFRAAYRRVSDSQSEKALEYAFYVAKALYLQGVEFGNNVALENAIAEYQSLLKKYPAELVPLDWAIIQNNLGNALRVLGGRESGTTKLEEAVVAYRAALAERTRERVPLDWAMTQNNLGSALGERESGTARLEEAVVAYRAALEEYTCERVPLRCTVVQNNLDAVLRILEQRRQAHRSDIGL